MKKIIAIFFLSALLFSLNSNFVFASPQPLEAQYPQIKGDVFQVPKTSATPFPVYARYVILFLVAVSGFVALYVLVTAGIQFIISTGNASQISEARDRIKAALLGLLVVLSYFLIVYTINPKLTEFDSPFLAPALSKMSSGVYVCTGPAPIPAAFDIQLKSTLTQSDKTQNDTYMEEISSKCELVPGSGKLSVKMNGNVKYVFLAPASPIQQYGAIIYDGEQMTGNAAIFFETEKELKVTAWHVNYIKASSIRPFTINFQPIRDSYVELFQNVRENYSDKNAPSIKITGADLQQNVSQSFNLGRLAQTLTKTLPAPMVSSLNIEQGKGFIVVFFRDQGGVGKWREGTAIDVYTDSKNDLNGSKMGNWRTDLCYTVDVKNNPDGSTYNQQIPYPCAAEVVVISASIY